MLLRDIGKQDAQVMAARDVIAAVDPDILVLADFDFDAELRALRAFSALFDAPYPYLFSRRPNAGRPSGLDLDGDGRLGQPRDAQGFGYFSGDGGLAVLSRAPLEEAALQDFTSLLWQELPGAEQPLDAKGAPFPSAAAQTAQRLSSTNHWALPVLLPERSVTLLISQAGPPVFDGPEDLNGKRNRDENRLWLLWLNGQIGQSPDTPVVLLAGTNLDPQDGEGHRATMRALLSHPRLQDPTPRSEGGAEGADPDQSGNPALDTADWNSPSPGNLRVDYILPDRALTVTRSGVHWPASGTPAHDTALRASRHRLVWVDLEIN